MRGTVVYMVSVLVFLSGCGSKKQLKRLELNDVWNFRTELRSDLDVRLQVLENLDVDYRREERRDSSGVVTVVSSVHVSQRKEKSGEQRLAIVEAEEGGGNEEVVVEEYKESKRKGGWLWWLVCGVLVGMGLLLWVYKKR